MIVCGEAAPHLSQSDSYIQKQTTFYRCSKEADTCERKTNRPPLGFSPFLYKKVQHGGGSHFRAPGLQGHSSSAARWLPALPQPLIRATPPQRTRASTQSKLQNPKLTLARMMLCVCWTLDQVRKSGWKLQRWSNSEGLVPEEWRQYRPNVLQTIIFNKMCCFCSNTWSSNSCRWIRPRLYSGISVNLRSYQEALWPRGAISSVNPRAGARGEELSARFLDLSKCTDSPKPPGHCPHSSSAY